MQSKMMKPSLCCQLSYNEHKRQRKKENLSVEIDASNKGSNYASIKRISSELLGINFIPSKKNISENDYVFEPFTSKSNKEPEAQHLAKLILKALYVHDSILTIQGPQEWETSK